MHVQGRLGCLFLLLVAGLFACSRTGDRAGRLKPKESMQFRLASFTRHPAWRRAQDPETGRPIYISPDVVVDARDIESLRYWGCDAGGYCAFEVTLTSEGGRRMMHTTGTHIGKYLAMLLGNKVQTAAVIFSPFGQTFQVGESNDRLTRELLKRVSR